MCSYLYRPHKLIKSKAYVIQSQRINPSKVEVRKFGRLGVIMDKTCEMENSYLKDTLK